MGLKRDLRSLSLHAGGTISYLAPSNEKGVMKTLLKDLPSGPSKWM
jgi:hypothetical protein